MILNYSFFRFKKTWKFLSNFITIFTNTIEVKFFIFILKSLWSMFNFNLCYSTMYVCVCSVMSNSATPWIMAHQAPLSIGTNI